VRTFCINLPISFTNLYKSDGPNTKYPTRSVTAISGAPTPSIPESCPKCNIVVEDDGRGVVEGKNDDVMDDRRCSVVEGAEEPPK
jgi:hypothetical protein